MLKRLMERRKEERGFTLIELMVVVLVIGILIAIALPTFLGARERAQDRAAQSNLRNGIAAAKVFFTDADSYGDGAGPLNDFDVADGDLIEPSINWVAAGDPAVGEVSIVIAGGNDVHLVAESASGDFFCIHDSSNDTGTRYGRGANYLAVDTEAECASASF